MVEKDSCRQGQKFQIVIPHTVNSHTCDKHKEVPLGMWQFIWTQKLTLSCILREIKHAQEEKFKDE